MKRIKLSVAYYNYNATSESEPRSYEATKAVATEKKWIHAIYHINII